MLVAPPFKEKVMKENIKPLDSKPVLLTLGFLIGCLFGVNANQCQAQTYVITNPAGYSQGTVQVQGNQAQVVNNAGYVTQNLTVYPTQATTQYGGAIGTPGYTIPPSPPAPPSPRVLQ